MEEKPSTVLEQSIEPRVECHGGFRKEKGPKRKRVERTCLPLDRPLKVSGEHRFDCAFEAGFSVPETPSPPEVQHKKTDGSFLVFLAVLAVVVAAFFYFDLGSRLSLATLQENRDTLRQYTDAHYPAAVLLFILFYGVQTAFALPGAAVMTLAGGFLFGTLAGVVYVNIGATSGATLTFLATRYVFAESIRQRFGARLTALSAGFSRDPFRYLLTLRFIPLFPFFLVNLACGLTEVPLGTYVVATAIGILPGSLVYTYAGRQMATLTSVADIASPRIVLALALLGALPLLSIGYSRWKEQHGRSV